MAQIIEPEQRHGGKDLAFVRNGIWQYYIVCGYAIGRTYKKTITEIIHVPDLASDKGLRI